MQPTNPDGAYTAQTRPVGFAGTSGEPGWTRQQVIVVALCALINALDGMDILIMSFVAPNLSTDWRIDPASLGMVFSAAFVGMMLGSLLLAPIADQLGRRPIVLAGVVLLSAGMIASGLISSLVAFATCRFVVGLGIGALLPSLAALISEHAPPARRTVAIGVYQAGYPMGAIATGFACIAAIPLVGWQATLVGAGCTSLFLLPVVWWLLPESLACSQEKRPLPRGGSFLSGGMLARSAMLWASTLLAYATLYFVTSWIPKLSVEAGLNASDALYASTVFNIGGLFGGLLMGYLAQRRKVGMVIALFFSLSLLAMLLFSLPAPLSVALTLAFAIGLTLQGGFTGYYSLSALLYPADMRSAGIGWAVGIGRAGSVVGPLLGGFLLARHLPLWSVFLIFGIPLIAAGMLAEIVGRQISRPAMTMEDGQ